jgi:hypothetical protein
MRMLLNGNLVERHRLGERAHGAERAAIYPSHLRSVVSERRTPGRDVADLTKPQALTEAKRRWGGGGAVRLRPPSLYTEGRGPGRLARYRYMVGNGGLGRGCTIMGQGNSWSEAFDDARPRPKLAPPPRF